MTAIERILAEKKRFTPVRGFNLVGHDDFEPLGQQLYLVDHFRTRRAAEVAMAVRIVADPSERLFIYAAVSGAERTV